MQDDARKCKDIFTSFLGYCKVEIIHYFCNVNNVVSRSSWLSNDRNKDIAGHFPLEQTTTLGFIGICPLLFNIGIKWKIYK